MSADDLPPEILTYIFELVVEDESLFEHTHPTAMTESSWQQKSVTSEWELMSPTHITYAKQIRKYTITKALMFTCRRWYKIAYHLLFEFLFLSGPSRLPAICFVLDRYAWLGWYVRRLHLMRFYAPRGTTLTQVEHMLVSIIHQCPNLELFTVDWAITPSFPALADALSTFSVKSLRSIHWIITPASLPRLIWALDSLPGLVSAHIEFELPPPTSESEDIEAADEASILLGAASELALSLPALTQLTLVGISQDFLEQACGWTLPVLQSFTLNFASSRHDLPDVVEFLTHHGSQLLFLDLNTLPAIDISAVLAACPMLKTISFNPDWRLPFHAESANPAATPSLISAPHPHITHIGLHQLLHAFLPPSRLQGLEAGVVTTYLLQRTNDLTFGQLTRKLFPALKVIRVLDRTLLKGLERNDGPEEEGLARWERWCAQCEAQGVRLEDCTGALLGDLPMDDEDDEDSEDEFDEAEGEPAQPAGIRPSNVKELQDLLLEIRRMSVGEEPPFQIPAL